MNRLRNRKLYAERLESRTLMAADGLGVDVLCVCEPESCPIESAPSVVDLGVDAVESDQQQPGDRVPFKGTFEVTISSFIPIDESTALVTFIVEGHGTHLGRFTGEAEAVFNLADLTYEGTSHWIGANGDTIFGTIAGSLTPTTTEGLFDNDETFTVEGGTGRFEGATGSGSAGGQINLVTGLGDSPFQGTISSPGSAKHRLP